MNILLLARWVGVEIEIIRGFIDPFCPNSADGEHGSETEQYVLSPRNLRRWFAPGIGHQSYLRVATANLDGKQCRKQHTKCKKRAEQNTDELGHDAKHNKAASHSAFSATNRW